MKDFVLAPIGHLNHSHIYKTASFVHNREIPHTEKIALVIQSLKSFIDIDLCSSQGSGYDIKWNGMIMGKFQAYTMRPTFNHSSARTYMMSDREEFSFSMMMDIGFHPVEIGFNDFTGKGEMTVLFKEDEKHESEYIFEVTAIEWESIYFPVILIKSVNVTDDLNRLKIN